MRQDQDLRRRPGARLTIGLLRFLYREWESGGFLSGVIDAAVDQGVNLICFNDQRLDASALQSGWVYDLASPASLDGLIIGATIGFGVSKDLLQNYCQRFADLPRVSAAVQLDGMPCVSIDGYSGMYQAVEHLVAVHRHQRIAFIRGPGETLDAEERFTAYRAVLEAHHLPLEPALVAQGDYTREAGQVAMQQILDRGVAFQAVAAANDHMAFGALEVLQAHGVTVPQRVALVGFDDFITSRLAAIPFTTVGQNIYQEGYQSVLTLLRLMRGEEVPARVLVPTQLIVRESCGCAPQLFPELAVAPGPRVGPAPGAEPELAALGRQRAPVLSDVMLALQSPARPLAAGYMPFADWETLVSQLWEAFVAALRAESAARFLLALEDTLRQARERGERLETWRPALGAFQQAAGRCLRAPHLLQRASLLLQQGQVLVGEALLRWQAYQQMLIERAEGQLQQIEADLMGLVAPAELARVLARYLPVLGVRQCYLALYTDRLASGVEAPPQAPDWRRLGESAELFLTCDEQNGVRLPEGPVFPARHLAPPGLFPDRRYTFLVQPLAFNYQQMGLVGYRLDVPMPALYARLTAQLGHALYRIYLIQRQQQTQHGLELRAAELAQANQELEAFSYSVSHDLRAPLRTINGYSQVLLDEAGGDLDAEAQRLLRRIQGASQHMAELIDDLLRLSRILRSEVRLAPLDLSALALEVVRGLTAAAPGRSVTVVVAPEVTATADLNLMRIALQNLLGNAWKFTAKNPAARIEFGVTEQQGETVYFVRDDGAGFDMAFADKLFGAFQRLHSSDEFEGTGIGLTIVQRIVRHHGGQIWAEGAPGQGATFYFTLRRRPAATWGK